MYVPKLYRAEEAQAMRQFVEEHPFALLISADEHARPTATHLPLLLETDEQGQDWLIGHLAAANPQRHQWHPEREVLAVFKGPDHYISSTWYDHVNVPTWNYVSVHVYGRIEEVEGDALYRHVQALMDRFEPPGQSPRSMDQLPAAMVRQEMRGVAGFRIRITSIEGAWKLSQNRHDKDYAHIVQTLEALDKAQARELAEAMRQRRPLQD